jgi:transcriptional regulator with XRE-family HTH domain
MAATSPHIRFRKARERASLSQEEVASQTGISFESIWDIESFEGELSSCYSPKEVQQLCGVLGMRPIELFEDNFPEPAISAQNLVQMIHDECRSRGIALEQFEDVVGWKLSECIEPPERLLDDMTIDGLQWLCRELRVNWMRVLSAL